MSRIAPHRVEVSGVTRRTWTAAALAALALVAAAVPAAAGSSVTSRKLYAYELGCGDAPGRLIERVRDYHPGCSDDAPVPAAGIPFREVTREPVGYTSDRGPRPLLLDRTRPVTGQVAAESWYHVVADVGVGQVTWDLVLWGLPARGRAVELGRTTVSATALPGQEQVSALFRIPLGAAARAPFPQVRLDVVQRGLNAGMTARRLADQTWLVLPLRAR